jgi:iron(III) transport system substrate-binding protein
MSGPAPRWALAPGIAGLMATAFLTSCGSGSGSAGTASITLYNGQHEQTTAALVGAFERQTGIKVKVRSGNESELALEIEQEGSASPADVIYTENSPALTSLDEKGLLSPLPPAVLTEVPSRYSSQSGDWVAISARVSVVVYNTSKTAPADVPTSVLGLADHRWKGKLAIAPSESDFLPIVTSIADADGRQAAKSWLGAVRSNAGSHIEPDNETLTSDVNNGQATLGIINSYYWYRLSKEIGQSNMHSRIAYFAPHDPGYVVDVSGAAVLKSSHHSADATRLVQFLASAAAGRILASSDSYEYPLQPGVSATAGLSPFDQLEPDAITPAQLGDGSLALELIQDAQFS